MSRGFYDIFASMGKKKAIRPITYLYKRARQIGKKRNMSVEDMAKEIRVARMSIYGWLKGFKTPNELGRQKLAMILEMDKEEVDIACGILPDDFIRFMRTDPERAWNYIEQILITERYRDKKKYKIYIDGKERYVNRFI